LVSRWFRPRETPAAAPDLTSECAELRARCQALSEEVRELRAWAHNSTIRTADPALFPRLLGPPLENLKVLLIGTCNVHHIASGAHALGHAADHFLYGSWRHDEIPSVESANYDAAVVGLTLAALLQEAIGRSMDVAHVLDFWTSETAEAALDRLAELLDDRVARFRTALDGLPIFFVSFIEPSFSYEGNLISSGSPKELGVFMPRLNEIFRQVVTKYPNCYLFDMNQCLNLVGRAHLSDDFVTHFTHNSIISDWDDAYDADRIVPPVSNFTTFDVDRNLRMLQQLIVQQLSDNLKIIRQEQSVKLIIADLDDTHWRGVAADDNIEAIVRTGYWPTGLVEALLYFKKRGGLLAICSKNDPEETKDRFPRFWHDRITLNEFVSVKINWRPKSENIADILSETGLLPESAVFIDDNPREIDEVRARFPSMRCLGGNHHDWRRIILQSPETQVAHISEESQIRTQLVRVKIDRDEAAKTLTREEWLHSLQLEQNIEVVKDAGHRLFARTFELLNKTNQFNTTGQRWTLGELNAFFAAEGCALVASLRDKTADNGLIGIVLVKGDELVQTVLSCRVFGLGAEIALGAMATKLALKSGDLARASLIDTGKNATCHDFFRRMGFTARDGCFVAESACATPDWIKVTLGEAALSVA
jgi:FkbH-like protein